MKSSIIVLLLLAAPLLGQQIPEGKPMGEIRVREFQGGHWHDRGTLSDWEKRNQSSSGGGTTTSRGGGQAGTVIAPPVKTPEQLRREAAEAEKTKGLEALAAGDYPRAIALLSHARISLPQDTAITDKLREARTALMKKIDAETDAKRRARIEVAIRDATASLEQVFEEMPQSPTMPSTWGDPMIVDLTDARTLAVDPKALKGLDIEPNGIPAAPPTGLPPAPPEPNPQRVAKPTDDSLLAPFTGKTFEDAFIAYYEQVNRPPAAKQRLHELVDESLKLLDAVPKRPIMLLSAAQPEELEASRLKVAKAVETFAGRYRELHGQATWRSIKEYTAFLQQLEDDGWWKPGDDIQKAIAADPELSRAVEAEAAKNRLRLLDYWDAAAETAYAELATEMRTIMTAGDTGK